MSFRSVQAEMSKVFKIWFFVFAFMFIVNVNAQEKSENIVQTISFCDLFRNPKSYDQKTVRVIAIYRYGYEWSDIFCLECGDEKLMRLELGDSFSELTKRKIRKKVKWSKRGKTVKVVAVGKFDATNQYRKKFIADYFESAEVILNDSSTTFPDRIKAKVNCLAEKNEK